MRRAIVIAVSVLGLSAAAALATSGDKLRHLAVPTLEDPSSKVSPSMAFLDELPACEVRRLGKLPGRVGALLETESGQIWAGGFDTGLYLLNGDAGSAARLPGLEGRERFINALAEHAGSLWAATYAGILEVDPSGARKRLHLPGIAAEALLVSDGALWAGTTQGLYRLTATRTFEDTGVTGPDGEGLRVTALAASGGLLWMGSPSGAYSVEPGGRRARWHPLVFGSPGAETNVVLSLAPSADGVVAGTDNGGLARISRSGEVRALRFVEPRANETNPGAAVTVNGATLFGTQGAGLLVLAGERAGAPRGWSAPSVSALHGGKRLLAGSDSGDVLEVRCRTTL